MSKSLDKIKEIDSTCEGQIQQTLEDCKNGNLSFEEAKRSILADTQNAISELKKLLPKEDPK